MVVEVDHWLLETWELTHTTSAPDFAARSARSARSGGHQVVPGELTQGIATNQGTSHYVGRYFWRLN